jgi:chemotaxis regulatin CheY-phosphate phosphatase CheZ|tara:strand:+ start:131 stop:322 length:192 start_codon:yes stop_codon:yes gene_type:complete
MKPTTKNKIVKKHILLNNETNQMLKEISNASYTNASQKIRSLIADDYQKLNNQISTFAQPRTV